MPPTPFFFLRPGGCQSALFNSLIYPFCFFWGAAEVAMGDEPNECYGYNCTLIRYRKGSCWFFQPPSARGALRDRGVKEN